MITKYQREKLMKLLAVEDVEDEGLDDGRFFVHLYPPYDFGTDPYNKIRTKSFDNFKDAVEAVKKAK